MSLFKKSNEQIKLQKIEAKKTKSLDAKFKRQNIFTNYNPWSAIFIMVTPTIISMVIFSTYQIFDKWIATQWGGGDVIGRYRDLIDIPPSEALKIINIATTYAAVPASIAIAFSVLVSIGTSVKFSIAYGKNNSDKMSNYVGNGFVTSVIISAFFTLGMYFLIPLIINFQSGGSGTAVDPIIKDIINKEAIRFSRILVLGSPLLFISNFWLNLLRSEGRVIANIVIILISCLTNIMLDFIFVIPGNLGMAGTAYATIISWFLIIVMALLLIYYSGSNLRFKFNNLKLKKALVFGILLIGISALLESAAQSMLAMFTTKILNTIPAPTDYPNDSNIPIYVQLYGGIMPWLILINAPIIGVSQGARSLVGYVYGTKNYYRVWQIIWRLIILLLVLLTISLLLVITAGQYMMHAFGVDLAMAKHFKSYIIMQFAFYPLATLHFIAIIFFQGSNHGRVALFASLQKTVIMPTLCLGLGYLIANSTSNGFYFYMMVGLIDLFAALVLLPLLLYTFSKVRRFIKKPAEEEISNPETENREVEVLRIKQK
ncbi:MATE family efflux transporter [Spiroplasma platyhelix]|uniref:MATE efflux family protein n=1 Tax=Spiroplasma platyhelix PALS-1 TaxID=1276218 RepID=A0A846U0Z3_9MOLU|nr:MATE family efflux transporter [Spiroplasma platyhelix]MBE4704116.1 hypothetical protein [Spiroplasma platyhelix PALS-1]NKE38486.1 hypothetical protein [Spiroplasma platyhelix PALS-1]UJB29374.1 hypothetical protein SPLAT_v1c06100 [Spiroplasma platyhelix PALS-1]